MAYHQKSVFVSNETTSPWYQAALFIQGTTVEDAEGTVLQDVALVEATDADGDLNWSIISEFLVKPRNKQYTNASICLNLCK